MVESGLFYSTFVDPLLVKLRKKTAHHIAPGQKIIDIACGTGALVFEMAPEADFVLGVDLSPSMIKKAGHTKRKHGFQNTEFRVCDASDLTTLNKHEFDVATLSLALHQFSPQLYTSVLNEMKRIAKKIIIVDYAVPLPENFWGTGSKMIEYLAGREHYRNFRTFYKKGGLESILKENDMTIETTEYFAKNIFHLVVVHPNYSKQ